MPHLSKWIAASFCIMALSAPISHAQSDSSGNLIPDATSSQKTDVLDNNPQNLSSTPTTSQKKIQVPTPEALKDTTKVVNEAYRRDLIAANTPQEKLVVVNKVLQSAGEEKNDISRFALLSKAIEVAMDGGDTNTAFAVIDQINSEYEIDALKMKTDMVCSIGNMASSLEQQQNIVAVAGGIVDKAIIVDRYDLARSMVETALSAARNAKDANLQRDAAAKAREEKDAETAYSAMKTSLVILAHKPNDPDANLKVGKYKCFIKDDWNNGLLMLALGSDETVKSLAVKEIVGATDADSQMYLGDGWWIAAEKETGFLKIQIQRRAGKWYKLVVPTLTGLAKAKVEARLESLIAVEPERTINLLKMVDVTRDAVSGKWERRNGTLVSDGSFAARIEFLYHPPAEYDYRMVFTRVGGRDKVTQLCWAAGHQFALHIGSGANAHIGFEMIDGKSADDNQTTQTSKGWLQNGQRYTVILKIRKNGVQAYLDGKLITEWKTDYNDMSLWAGWRLHRDDTIGIGSAISPTVFYSAEIVEITGKGELLKP